jgi:hypothetical protein
MEGGASKKIGEMKGILDSLDDIKEALRDMATSLRIQSSRTSEGPFRFFSEIEGD